jgi:thiol-disulfide isomerase/thioredoxin
MHGSVWVASYVMLWIAVLVLGFAVVALLRQVGVLHARLAPMGTHFAGEGPDLDSVAPAVGLDYERAVLTVLAFTSPSCTVCRELRPSIDALRRQYRELQVQVVDLDPQTQPVFDAFLVRSTPYVVTVDRTGVVRGRGVANSLEQIEELVRESRLAAAGAVPGGER